MPVHVPGARHGGLVHGGGGGGGHRSGPAAALAAAATAVGRITSGGDVPRHGATRREARGALLGGLGGAARGRRAERERAVDGGRG